MLSINNNLEKKYENQNAKPFLKWVGGKTQLLPKINTFYPFNGTIDKYIEPFVGGGAVLFDVLNKCKPYLSDVFISDINVDLINCYAVIRDKVEKLIETLNKYKDEYMSLSKEERTDYYNEKRKQFNRIKNRYSFEEKSDCIVWGKKNNYSMYQVRAAAMFIFLNKTCFNGLYRENANGEFNVPMGEYKNPEICDEENLRICSAKLHGCFICSCDFATAIAFADNHCFVYLDPPYRPITETSSFTSYNKMPFDDVEQIRLAESIKRLNNRKGRFLLSNSDPHNTNPKDDFFDNLYSEFEIIRVKAGRAINSDGSKRGKVSEIMVFNKPAHFPKPKPSKKKEKNVEYW